MKRWRAYIGIALVLCLLAGISGCSANKIPAPSGGTEAPGKPRVASKADSEAALKVLDQELTSIVQTLEALDLVDEQDLTP